MNVEVLKIVAPIGVAVAAVLAAALALAGLPLSVALALAIIAGAVIVWLLPRRADGLVLRALPTAPLDEARAPRMHNVLSGLCDTYGYRRPEVVLIDDPAINAVAFGRKPDRAVLAVTRGLVDGLDRMQLEGVLARELAAINAPTRPAATAAVAARPFVPESYVRARLARMVDRADPVRFDFDGVKLTRYPPGLADALEHIATHGSAIRNANPAARHLWLVDPIPGASGGDWDVNTRVDALREL